VDGMRAAEALLAAAGAVDDAEAAPTP
jgi:hypothetical protein